jgi:hypothetical protein
VRLPVWVLKAKNVPTVENQGLLAEGVGFELTRLRQRIYADWRVSFLRCHGLSTAGYPIRYPDG